MAWWIVFLVSVVIAFIAVQAVILPEIFLKPSFGGTAVKDRGRRIIEETHGKSIVYEPAAEIRKYIKQYILSERNGHKLFTCNISESIRYIDYDVVLFNAEGRAFKVLNIKEVIEQAGYTNVTKLPAATSYVTVILNSTDSAKFESSLKAKIPATRAAAFVIVGAVADITAVICCKICAGHILGGLYGESFLALGASWPLTLGVCAAVVALNVIYALLAIYLTVRKPKGGRKRVRI